MGRTRSNPVAQLHLVGHEAGALAPWLHRELQARGLPMVLLETRHAAAALEAQRNKTDKNDARGLAQLVRSGWFRSVHVKSEESYRLKLLLTSRRLLKRKLVDIENEMRQSLKAFGLLLGPRVQRACGHRRAVTAVARKLAVIMHGMWLDGTEFRFATSAPTNDKRSGRKRAALAAA